MTSVGRLSIRDIIESDASRRTLETALSCDSISGSRAVAVDRVFTGGKFVTGAIGLGLLATTGLLGAVAFPVAIGAAVLGGIGLMQIGRAAKHLRRYGSTPSLLGFDAAVGLGLSATTFTVLNWFYVSGTMPGWVAGTVALLTFEFGVLLLVLVLRALFRGLREP